MKPIIVDLKDISDSTEVYDSKPNRFVPYTIYIICAILTIALIWMYLFRMDIVVKADSVFRGDDDSTAVSCAVTGKITKMSVKDGQYVSEGDELYEVDIENLGSTKDGAVAGPRTLEHMVDTVLYFEGDRYESYRILRGVKNRFGSTNEIGVFEMKAEGLVEVENPSEYMLSGKPEGASGSIVTCSIEGSRPILLEIQALVCHSFFNNPRRTANGTDYNKVNLLMAVLEKRANLSLSDCDAYVNIAGGIRMNEPAIDLGIVLAIASSKKDIIVREDTICFGEVGLSGEVRGVTMSEQRVAEAKKLGFKKCIVPKVCLAGVSHISGIEIVGVANIKEAIEAVR